MKFFHHKEFDNFVYLEYFLLFKKIWRTGLDLVVLARPGPGRKIFGPTHAYFEFLFKNHQKSLFLQNIGPFRITLNNTTLYIIPT